MLLAAQAPPGRRAAQRPDRKQLLVWCDTRYGGAYHDSVPHAMAVIEKIGRDTGLYDAYLRTDSQLITKQKISVFADGRDWPVNKNLNYFDGIFFFGMREIELTDQQKADLLSFVWDDGKGFVAAHTADTAFLSWPEFGEMLGGRFDEHPWETTDATVVVDDFSSPMMKNFPKAGVFHDEHYQLKDFSRDKLHVLAHLDASTLDLKAPLVHRTDGDFPVAWTKSYGKGRVFYSTLGHEDVAWDTTPIQSMYFEALKWSMRIGETGDVHAAVNHLSRHFGR